MEPNIIDKQKHKYKYKLLCFLFFITHHHLQGKHLLFCSQWDPCNWIFSFQFMIIDARCTYSLNHQINGGKFYKINVAEKPWDLCLFAFSTHDRRCKVDISFYKKNCRQALAKCDASEAELLQKLEVINAQCSWMRGGNISFGESSTRENKLASLEATLVRNYHPVTDRGEG